MSLQSVVVVVGRFKSWDRKWRKLELLHLRTWSNSLLPVMSLLSIVHCHQHFHHIIFGKPRPMGSTTCRSIQMVKSSAASDACTRREKDKPTHHLSDQYKLGEFSSLRTNE